MKKFLSICLAAIMIASVVSVAAFAAAADWTKGNGFNVVEQPGDRSTRAEVSQNTPVTVVDAANGAIKVSQGGYFQSAANWGGVSSNNAYDLNGLEIEIKFEKVPELTADLDCWIAVDLLKNAGTFDPSNVAANPGFMTLIRFNKPFVQVMNGLADFSAIYDTQAEEDNSVFAIKSGDVFTLKVNRNKQGTYDYTFTNNGKSFKVAGADLNNAGDFATAFEDGKAHVTVMCSALNAAKDGFVYEVKVTNGVELTEADKQAAADALAAAEQAEADRLAQEQAELDALLNGEMTEEPDAEVDANNDASVDADTNVDVVEEGGVNVALIIIIVAVVIIAAVVVIVLLKKKGAKK